MALAVPDLRAAEEYYRTVFEAELVGREARLPDGFWYTLPFDKDWDDAGRASIEMGMVALRRDEMVLALFAGGSPHARPLFIGLSIEPAELVRLRSRLPRDTEVTADEPTRLEFRDRYGVRWQIYDGTSRFRTSGEIARRWLEV